MRWWSGVHWSDATRAVDPRIDGHGWTAPFGVPPAATQATRNGGARKAIGTAVLVLGIIVLIGSAVLAVLSVVDAVGATSKGATIVAIDDGWCTYTWEGEPQPDPSLSEDTCPDGAEVGLRVPIVVTPDGSAWTTWVSYIGTSVLVCVLGAVFGAALSLAGWILRS